MVVRILVRDELTRPIVRPDDAPAGSRPYLGRWWGSQLREYSDGDWLKSGDVHGSRAVRNGLVWLAG